MANIERMKELHQFILNLPPKNFQWSSVRIPEPAKPIKECGTPACVAGWTYYLWPDELTLHVYELDNRLVQVLGITKEEACFVCFGDEWNGFPNISNLDFPEQKEVALGRLETLIKHYESNIS
jgi:hypothetical protein